MQVVRNRPHVVVQIAGPRGIVDARLHVDTGGGGMFLLHERAARALGLSLEEADLGEGPALVGPIPKVTLGGVELDVRERIYVPLRSAGRDEDDGQIGPLVLARYNVTFDYPAGRFELRAPGEAPHRGTRMSARWREASFRPLVEVNVDGEALSMLLDTGASYSMISGAQIDRWADLGWRFERGALDEAVMGVPGEDRFRMASVPRLAWGPFEFEQVGFIERPPGTFEDWMTSMMPAPIVGALGGNVLKELRIELDYVEQAVYVERR